MSRFQLSLNVSDVDTAVTFYTKLLGVGPAKHREGYANFLVADPPLKLVLVQGEGEAATINHVGIEVPGNQDVLGEADRLAGEGLKTHLDPTHTCCYATQDKVWVADPDGVPWEVYNVIGDTEHFGAAGHPGRDLGQELPPTLPVTPIGREELAAKLGTVVLIDAQGPGWYAKGHLPGAVCADGTVLADLAASHIPAADSEVVVYCWNAACSGSTVLAAALADLGYTRVRRYIEGKQDWAAHGHPLATGLS